MDQNLKEKANQNPSRERAKVKKKSKMLNAKTISQGISNLDGNQNVVISDQQPIIVKKE